MLGLMSRGYICPIVPAVLVDVRPVITDTRVLQPVVSGASLGPQPGAPKIQSASQLTPEIKGAISPAVPAPSPSPSLTGGSLIAPIITSGEED